jgi:MFS transporter, DHA1 family, tetracycline resistance protein
MRRNSGHGLQMRGPLGIVFTTVLIDLIGFGVVLPILPLYAKQYGASALQVGLLTASYAFAQFIFAPILGRLSDRVGRRPVILLALSGTIVAATTMGLANALWLLFVARTLDGVSGASYAVGQAYVADLTGPEDRAKAMGMIGAAFGIGLVIGPGIGALASLVSPRLPFFITAGIAAANLAVAWRRLPESKPAHVGPQRGRLEVVTAALRNRDVAPFVWVSLVGTFAFVGMEATFALFGADRLGYGLAQTGMLFAYIGLLSAVVQGWLVRVLVPRHGEAAVLRAGLVITALGLAAIAPCTRTWELLLAGIPLALGSGLVFPTLTAIVSKRTGAHEQGGVLGVLASTNGLARVVGPVAATAAFQHVGVWAPYVIGGALFLLCLGVVGLRVPGGVAAVSGQ